MTILEQYEARAKQIFAELAQYGITDAGIADEQPRSSEDTAKIEILLRELVAVGQNALAAIRSTKATRD